MILSMVFGELASPLRAAGVLGGNLEDNAGARTSRRRVVSWSRKCDGGVCEGAAASVSSSRMLVSDSAAESAQVSGISRVTPPSFKPSHLKADIADRGAPTGAIADQGTRSSTAVVAQNRGVVQRTEGVATAMRPKSNDSSSTTFCRPRFPYVRSRTAFPEIAVQLKVQLQQHIATSGAQVAAPKVFRWVEIGSRRCLNTEQMLNMLRARMPTGWSIETYAVDSWGYRGPEAVADNNDDKEGQAHMAECRSAIGHLPGVHLVKNLSVSAASLFDDGFFDFVYIDALHTYEYCAADMAAWYPKTKPGGLFSGDDFGDVMLASDANLFVTAHVGRSFRWGVIRAVTEFAIQHSIDYHVTAYETHYDAHYSKRARPEQSPPNWYLVKPHPMWATCDHVRWPGDVLLGPDGNTSETFVEEQIRQVHQYYRQLRPKKR